MYLNPHARTISRIAVDNTKKLSGDYRRTAKIFNHGAETPKKSLVIESRRKS